MHTPLGLPRVFRHVEGPLMTLQLWKRDDGTTIARVIMPWERYGFTQQPASEAFWHWFAGLCHPSDQPFSGSELHRFLTWRREVLGPMPGEGDNHIEAGS